MQNKRTRKKLLSFVLTLMMLLSLGITLPAGAEGELPQIGEELLKNGGFEILDDNANAANWGMTDPTWSPNTMVTNQREAVHSGNYGLSMHMEQGGLRAFAYSQIPIVPGYSYTIECMYKSTAVGVRLFVEYYNSWEKSAATYTGAAADNMQPAAQDWTKYSFTFQGRPDASVAAVYINMNQAGRAWFDDVSVKVTQEPQQFSYETDDVFYYSDRTEDATASISPTDYYTGYEGYAEFSFLEADKVLFTDKKTLADGKASFAFPMSLLAVKEYPYETMVTVYTEDGQKVQDFTQTVYMYDRPGNVMADGTVMMDGKVFNPVIMNCVYGDDAFERAKEMGCNVVTSYVSEAAVKKAADAGLKILGILYPGMKPAGHPDNAEYTKNIVETYKESPHIYGWLVMDEPTYNFSNPWQSLEDSYVLIRGIDKNHPICITDEATEKGKTTSKYADVHTIDPYVGGGGNTSVSTFVGSRVENYMNYLDGRKPLHALLQSYPWQNYMPTAGELRTQVYQALYEGARGIGYYGYAPGGSFVMSKHEFWDDLVHFGNQELPVAFEEMTTNTYPIFNMAKEEKVWYRSVVRDGKIKLMVMNPTDEAQSVNIPLKSGGGTVTLNGFTAKEVFAGEGKGDGKAVKVTGSTLKAELLKNETIIYEITPDGIVNFASLPDADYTKKTEEAPSEEPKETEKPEAPEEPKEPEVVLPPKATRLSFIKTLVNALDLSPGGTTFPDCDAPEAATAREAGLIVGDTSGNFRPDDSITRQDVMVIVQRSLSLPGNAEALNVFTDAGLISDYARDAVSACVSSGIIVGMGDGTVNPMGLLTEEQAGIIAERVKNYTPPKEVITFDETPEETEKQKWEKAQAFLKAMGVGDIPLESSVTRGDFETLIGVFLGITYDVFSDDLKAITKDEAIGALLKLLGYDIYEETDGNAQITASRIGLLDGVGGGEYLRGGEICVLLRNAADIFMVERTAFGSEYTFGETEETLLSAYRKIYRYKGVVEENLYTDAQLSGTEMLLCDRIFKDGAEYFGQKVTVYTHGEENETVYIEPAAAVKITEISGDAIDKGRTTKDTLYTGEDIYRISGARLIYNGSEKKEWTKADVTPEVGTVTLISNTGGDVDCIIVWSYETHVVKSVLAEEDTVITQKNEPLILDARDSYLAMDVSLSALKAWTILSVAKRGDGHIMKVLASDKKVMGTVTELGKEDILVGETRYAVSPSLSKDTKALQPVLSVPMTLYLDALGQVAAVDYQREYLYGYLVESEEAKGLSGAPKFKLFTEDGKMQVYATTDIVEMNGNPVAKSAILNDSEIMQGGEVVRQLLRYSLTDEKISKIETAMNYVNNFDDPNREAAFSIDFTIDDKKDANGETSVWFVGEGTSSFGTRFLVRDETKIFIIPPAGSPDENYMIQDWTQLVDIDTAKRYAHTKLYDTDENMVVNAMTWETFQDPHSYLGFFDPPGLITGVRQILDDSEEAVWAIDVFTVGGGKETMTVPADFDVLFKEANTDLSKDPVVKANGGKRPEMIKPGELRPGDIIQYKTTPKGEAATIVVQYRGETPGGYESAGYSGQIWATTKGRNYLGNVFRGEGTVTSVGKYGVTVNVFLYDAANDKATKTKVERTYPTAGVTVLWDSDNQTAKKITIDEIRVNDTVVAINRTYTPRMMVVYR